MVSVVFVGTWGAVQWIPLWVSELAGPDNPRAKALAMVIVSFGACTSTFIAPSGAVASALGLWAVSVVVLALVAWRVLCAAATSRTTCAA